MKNNTHNIIELPIKTLVIEPALSGRSAKELSANAKELAPKMEAAGGWEPSQPGQFVTRAGKKHLIAGFTRCAAAELAKIKVGYFVEVEDAPALRTACIRTNLGKPISAFEQGRVYAAMRAGTDETKAEKGETIFKPMTTQEIAAEVGYTRQHIEQCIGIFESSPEIGALIESGEIAETLATISRQQLSAQFAPEEKDKAEAKQLRYLRAAIAVAKKEGKDKATRSHLDAVRPDFAPVKASVPAKPDKPANGKNDKPAKPDAPDDAPEPPESTLDLGTPEPAKPVTFTKDEQLSALLALILSLNEVTAAQAEKIALALVNAGVSIGSPSPL